MKIWHIIILLVLVGGVALTFNDLIKDSNYGVSSNLNNTRLTAFDTSNSTSNLANTLEDESQRETEPSASDALFSPIRIASGVYQALKNMIPTSEGLLNAAQKDLGVPSFIIGIFSTILLIVILWKSIEFWKE